MANKKCKVLIASPRKGDFPEEFVNFRCAVERAQSEGFYPDHEIAFGCVSGTSINIARNTIAWYARDGNYDKVLMVDLDVLATPGTVLRIISHDVPIVAGLYMKRNGMMSWLGRPLLGGSGKPDEQGLVEYEDLPTGFMCIDVKKCLEVMIEAMPEISYDAVDDPDAKVLQYNTMHEFFPMGITGSTSWREKFLDLRKAFKSAQLKPKDERGDEFLHAASEIFMRTGGTRIFRGEDYHFCWLARQCGLKVYADWKCFLHHKGSAVYPLDPQFICNMADTLRAKQKQMDEKKEGMQAVELPKEYAPGKASL